jgi:hypothetical protein
MHSRASEGPGEKKSGEGRGQEDHGASCAPSLSLSETDERATTQINEINKHPFLRPLPFAPSALSREARHPLQPYEMVTPNEGDKLDEEILGVLATVLKLRTMTEAGKYVRENRYALPFHSL